MHDDVTRSLFQGSAEEDERFKYRVIEGMSESIRQLAAAMADMQRTQVGMLERLATLEASKFADSIAGIKSDVKSLMTDKERRDGAYNMLGTLRVWAPFVTLVLTAAVAFVVYGRMVGVVPPSPVRPAAVEATIQRDDRTIHGTVSQHHDGR